MNKKHYSLASVRKGFSDRNGRRSIICIALVLVMVASVLTNAIPGIMKAKAAYTSPEMLTSYNGKSTIPAVYSAVNVPEGTPVMSASQYKNNSVTMSDGISAFDFHIFADEFSSTVHTCGNVATNLLKGAPEFGSRSNHELDVERVSYVKAFQAWATSTKIEDTNMIYGQGVSFHKNGQFFAKCGNADVALGNDNNGSITGHIYIEGSEPYVNIAAELQDAEDYMRYLVWLQNHTNPDDGAVKVVDGISGGIYKGSSGSYTIDLTGVSEPTVILDLTETEAKKIFRGSVKFTGTAGKRVIVNILDENGDGVKFEDTNMTADNLSNSEDSANKDNNLLWNFYKMENGAPESTTGTVWVGGTWIGSINAPEATVECHAGLNGSIIADTVRTYCETHKSDYTGERSKKKEITLTLHKQWKGDNNNSSVRPDYITVEVYRDKQLYMSIPVSPEDCEGSSGSTTDWIFKIKDLPAMDGKGNTYNYTIKEKPVAGYSSVVFNKTIVNTYLGIVPELEEYTLQLGKTDNAGTALPGAVLRLTAKDSSVDLRNISVTNGRNVTKTASSITWTSDGNVVKFEHMPKGVYTVSEVTAPEGYKVADNKTINLMNNITDSIIDYPLTVDISKMDGSSVNDRLPGAVLKLTSNEGKNLEGVRVDYYAPNTTPTKSGSSIQWTTGGDKVMFTGIPAGTYTLTELSAPSGYQIAAPVVFSIDSLGNVTCNGSSVNGVTMTDNLVPKEYKYYDLTVSKKDGTGSSASFVEDAVMELTAGQNFSYYNASCSPSVSGAKSSSVSGNKVTWTTGTGAVTISGLPEGDYILTENGAPVGYVLADALSVTLDGNKSVTVVDKELTASISKRVAGGSDELPGARLKLELLSAENNGATLAGVTGTQSISHDSDTVISWTSGNADNDLNKIPAGIYKLSEVDAPEGYLTAKDIYIKITNDGKIYSVPSEYLADGQSISSINWGSTTVDTVIMEDKELTVRIYKQIWNDDGDDVPEDNEYSEAILAGAQLKFTYPSASGKSPENFTTGNEAQSFGGIKDGVYVFSETAAPDGFAAANDIRFELENGRIVNCNINTDRNDVGYSVNSLGGSINNDPFTSVKVEDDGSISVMMVDKKIKTYVLGVKKILSGTGSGGVDDVYIPGAKMAIFEAVDGADWDYYSSHADEALETFVSTNVVQKFFFPRGTYAIVELEAPKGYELKTSVTTATLPYQNGSGASWSFTNKKETPPDYTTDLHIRKTDPEGNVIDDPDLFAVFKVYDSDNQPVYSTCVKYAWDETTQGPRSYYKYTSDPTVSGATCEYKSYKGHVQLHGIPYGEYTVVEVVPPEGYFLNSEERHITVTSTNNSYPRAAFVSFDDYEVSGSLTVFKRDAHGNLRDNAIFMLYRSDTADGEGAPYAPIYTTGEVSTSGGGKATYEYLPFGYYYYFKEIVPPDGCKLPENEEDRYTERIFLTDDPTLGVTDGVVSMDDEEIQFSIEKTDKNGKPVSGALLKLESVFNEPGTEEYYYPNEAMSFVNGGENGRPRLEYVTGTIPVNYYGDPIYSYSYTGAVSYNGMNYEYVTWKSGDSANVINGLPAGKYCLSELEAPNGYEVCEPMFFIVDDTGNVKHVDGTPFEDDLVMLENERSKGSITLTKRDADANYLRIKDAKFKLLRKNGSGYDEIVTDSANVYTGVSSSGTVFTTDENGQITVTGLDYDYEYRFAEIESTPGYDSVNLSVVDTELTADKLEQNVTAYNSRISDKILWIYKVDNKDAPIEGAKFDLYRREAGTDGEFELFGGTYETDENGQIKIENLAWDYEYKAVETEAAFGYILDEDTCFGSVVIEKDSYAGTAFDKEKSVTITIVNNPSTTNVYISKLDVTNSEELSGADLAVTDSKGNEVDSWKSTNEKHLIENLTMGTYTLTETTAPDGYLKAETITFTVDKDGKILVDGKEVTNSTVVMKDAPVTTDVYISKVDMAGGEELSGADLIVKDSKGKEIAKWTSSNEKHLIEKLGVGTYTLTETTAPDGYRVAESITFIVDKDGKIFVDGKEVTNGTVVMKDAPVTANVYISKVDMVGGEELPNAELIVRDAKGNEVSKWTSTTEKHYIESLRPGTYTLTEITAPEGYVKAENITFVVDKDGNITVGGKNVGNIVVMKDAPVTAGIYISKVDITNGEELSGADLIVTDSKGNEVDSWKSTNAVHLIKTQLTMGTYTLTEITAPDGYLKAETITFTVDKDGKILVDGKEVTSKTVVMKDAPVTANVYISKVDMVGGEELSGADLIVKDSKGKEIAKWTSTNEKHLIEKLGVGTYTLTETTAPDGYLKAETITFTVDKDGKILVDGKEVTNSTVVMKDAPNALTLSKQAVGGGKELEGASLTLTAVSGTDLKNYTVPEGVTLKDKTISWTSGSKAVTLNKIPDGIYSFTEVTAPKGYEVAETIYVKVENGKVYSVASKDYKGADTMWGTSVTNDTVIMFDAPTPEPAETNFSFTKYNNVNAALTGAKFKLTGDNGYSQETTSSSTGEVYFYGMKEGKYTLTETEAPKGHVKSAATVSVVVDSNGEKTYFDASGNQISLDTVQGLMKNSIVPVEENGKKKDYKPGDKIDLYEKLVKDHEEYADLDIVWESSDDSIATVDKYGKVTILKPGDFTITAKVGDVELGKFVLGAEDVVSAPDNGTPSGTPSGSNGSNGSNGATMGSNGGNTYAPYTGETNTTPVTGDSIFWTVVAAVVLVLSLTTMILIRRRKKADK